MIFFAGCTALFISYLLPGHYPPWGSFEQQTAAAIGLALMSIAVLAMRKEGLLLTPSFAMALALAATIPWIQWFLGQVVFLDDALMASIYLLCLAVSGVVGSTLVRFKGDLFDWIAWALVFAGAASAALGFMQWWGADLGVMAVPKGGARITANLAQPNHLSTLLALALVSAAWLFERSRLTAAIAAAIGALCLSAMVLTQSRTGWLFVVLLICWRLWARGRRIPMRSGSTIYLAGGILFGIASACLPVINRVLLLSPAEGVERLQAGTRWIHWKTLIHALGESPLVGYGWTQIGLAQQKTATAFPATHEALADSHNLILDLLLWNGIPLGAILVAGVAAWILFRICACRTAEQWTLLAGIGAILTHAMFEYPLDFTYFLVPLGLMMGAAESQQVEKVRELWRSVFGVLVAVLIVIGGWVADEYLTVQDSTRQLRFSLARIGVGSSEVVPPPDVVLLRSLRAVHGLVNTPASGSMSAEALDDMKAIVSRYPTSQTLLRYATAAGLNGRAEDARKNLDLISKMTSDARCMEAIASWHALQAQYPQLRSIGAPQPEPAR